MKRMMTAMMMMTIQMILVIMDRVKSVCRDHFSPCSIIMMNDDDNYVNNDDDGDDDDDGNYDDDGDDDDDGDGDDDSDDDDDGDDDDDNRYHRGETVCGDHFSQGKTETHLSLGRVLILRFI